MLALTDIRKWIAGFGIAGDDHVYIGKLDNKKQKSIGVYSRPASGQPYVALGGLACTTYDIRRISLLVHWNRSKSESEKAAYALFEKLRNESENTRLTIGDTQILQLQLQIPEPKDVGTDDNGVYEYVIWLDFLYERKK